MWIVINWYYFENQNSTLCASLFQMMHQFGDVFVNVELSQLYRSGKWSTVSGRGNSMCFITWYPPGVGFVDTVTIPGSQPWTIYVCCSAKRDLTSKFSNLSLRSYPKKHVLLILKVVLFLLCIKYNYVNRGKEGGNVIWNCSPYFRNTYRSVVIEKLLYQYDMHHSKNKKK